MRTIKKYGFNYLVHGEDFDLNTVQYLLMAFYMCLYGTYKITGSLLIRLSIYLRYY